MSVSKNLSTVIRKNDNIPDASIPYLREISISVSGIRASFNLIHKGTNHDAKFLIKKAMAIDTYNIDRLLSGAGLNKSLVSTVYGKSNLIDVRNSICHVEQRIEMKEIASRGKPRELNWETREVAGGLGSSDDGGKTWSFTGSIYGLHISGDNGAKTNVGMVNDFLICQSQQGCVALDLSAANFEKMYHMLFSSIEKIRAGLVESPSVIAPSSSTTVPTQ